jgi:O-antigen ligase
MLGESPLTSAFITAFFYLFAILVITLLAGMPDEMRVSVLRSAGLVLIATAAVSVVIGRWKGYVSTLRYGFEIDLNPNWIGLFVSVGLLITVCCRLNPLYKILFLAIGSFALFVTGSRAAILSTLLTVSVREGTWFIGKLSKRLAISVVLVFFLSFGVGTLSGAVRGVMNQLLYQVANLAIDLLGSALGIDFFRQFRLNPELIEMGETDREDIMAALFRAYRVSFFGFGARATNVILAGLISKISHNSYASILFDYGITGFLVITCILLLSLLRIVRADIARGRKFGPEASVILCVAAFAAYHDVLLSFLSPSGIIFWISVCSAFDTSRGGKIQNGIRTWTLGKRADLGAEKGECNL